jgi:hypothetical protein
LTWSNVTIDLSEPDLDPNPTNTWFLAYDLELVNLGDRDDSEPTDKYVRARIYSTPAVKKFTAVLNVVTHDCVTKTMNLLASKIKGQMHTL